MGMGMQLPPLPICEVTDPNASGPMRLPGVPADCDPYGGLEIASGCENPNSEVRRIAEQVRQAQSEAARATVVCPKGFLNALDGHAAAKIGALISARLSPNSIFLLTDPAGRGVYQSSAFGLSRGILEGMANFSDTIHGKMDSYRDMRAGLDAVHRSHIPALLDFPDGALLIETGAGRDVERLKALHALTLKHRGAFVCHDIPPAASRWAAGTEDLAGIPYIALPARHEFFGPALRGYPGPVLISMQNTLSSMSFGSIRHFLQGASAIGTRRIIVNQSVGISDTSNFLPAAYNPDSTEFSNLVAENLPELFLREGISYNRDSGMLLLMSARLQVAHTVRVLALDLAHRTIRTIADEQHGFKSSKNYVIAAQKNLEPAEARAYLELFQTPLTPYLGLTFNTLTIGPFGIQFSMDSAVPKGALKICNLETVCVIDRERAPQLPALTTPGTQVFEPMGAAQVMSAASRHQRYTATNTAALLELHQPGIGVAPETLRKLGHDRAVLVGAQLGLSIVFDLYGQRLGVGHIGRWGADAATRRQYEQAFLR